VQLCAQIFLNRCAAQIIRESILRRTKAALCKIDLHRAAHDQEFREVAQRASILRLQRPTSAFLCTRARHFLMLQFFVGRVCVPAEGTKVRQPLLLDRGEEAARQFVLRWGAGKRSRSLALSLSGYYNIYEGDARRRRRRIMENILLELTSLPCYIYKGLAEFLFQKSHRAF
jgi:hypothetical protein